jgi:hypothetical protein
LGGIFICISEKQLLQLLFRRMTEPFGEVVAVGNSSRPYATAISTKFNVSVVNLPVTTTKYSKLRQERKLDIPNIELSFANAVLIDDVAVSGLTLVTAAHKCKPFPATAAVGALFEASQVLDRLSGSPLRNIKTGFNYRAQKNGFIPPLNTLQTALEDNERLVQLSSTSLRVPVKALRKTLGELLEVSR